MKLDIGSGPEPYKDFTGLDHIQFNENIVKTDLNKPLEYESNSIDEIYSNHTLEHLDNPMDMIREIHRVLKPGARATIIVPYGMHTASKRPNHKNYWNLTCIDYFDGTYCEHYPKWASVEFDHEWGQSGIYRPLELLMDWIISINPGTYEKRFAYIFPFFSLIIRLVK